MHRAHLILTLDYELFGNGSGDLFCCVVEPAACIAALAERHGARLEIFVDALEFHAMERHAWPGIKAVRRQLQDLMRRGHGLQLHLHPQWHIGAQPTPQGWALDATQWRIGSLSPPAAAECIGRGHRWLCKLMGEVRPGARPIAFRAGGWAIQPGRTVLAELQRLGVRIDSSVAPGMRNRQRSDWFDFRGAPGRPSWRVDTDVCMPAPQGPTLEVPIAVGRIGRLLHARMLAQRRGSIAPGCRGLYDSGASVWQKLHGLMGKLERIGRSMLDFSTLETHAMAVVAQDWLARWPSDPAVPLVAIGHTKNFGERSAQSLDAFLSLAAAQPDWVFSDYARFEASA